MFGQKKMVFANNFSLSLQKYFRFSLALIMPKSYIYANKTDIQTNRVYSFHLGQYTRWIVNT